MLYWGGFASNEAPSWFNAIIDGRSANCVRVGRGVFV